MNANEIKFLVVDDMSTMRKIVKKCLVQNGHDNDKILEAEDGVPALEILRTKPIDFIVCDWNMPKMTGLDLLKEIKKDPKLAKIPFLFVTAEAEKDNIMEALKSGADNYIVKPFTANVLKEKVTAICNKHNL